MEYLEYDFAQIEHVNQILHNVINNKQKYKEWDCFDTSVLLEQYPELGHYNESKPENSYIIIPSGVKTIRGEVVTSHNGIRYNSFIVNIRRYTVKEDDVNVPYWEYTFEVRNSLWDGKYKVSKTTKTNGEYDELVMNEDYTVRVGYDDSDDVKDSSEKSNVIRIIVKGSQGRSIRVCFHMNLAADDRTIEVTNLQLTLESGDEYTHQYDTLNYEGGKVSLNNGENTSNCTVSITPCDKEGNILTTGTGETITEDTPTGTWIPYNKVEKVKSDFNMGYGPTSVPGTYYCMMKAVSSNSNIVSSLQKIIKVNKVQKEKAVIDWGDDSLYDNIWKGCKHKYRIGFNLENEFGVESENKDKLVGSVVNITFIKSTGKRVPQTCTIQKDSDGYYAEAVVSYRQYYDNYSTLEVEVDISAGFGKIMDQRIIKHPWYVAKNYNEIVNQLYYVSSDGSYVDEDGNAVTEYVENDYGTDWIFCDVGSYDVVKPMYLFRDITIASLQGTGQTVFKGNNQNIIETVNDSPSTVNFLKINLIGLTFTGAQSAVISNAGTRLLVDKCVFSGNNNTAKHHRGCSIYIPDTDWSIKNNDYWKTEIRNSYFKNNKGNEIQSVGETKIYGNLFITTGSEFLQQPEVKVVSVRGGSVEYRDNTSYINTGKKPMASNHSYAKALAYVDRGCTFNGKGPNRLGGDLTLPLYGEYNNKAYTYSIYYYPYSNVRTEIVCSPRRGYERKATGHASSFKNWVFYDGYYFVRWEKGRNVGNTRNPWTDKELEIPSNNGIFDYVKEKFIENYDPRVADSKSMTSAFDK